MFAIFSKNLVGFLAETCSEWGPQSKSMRGLGEIYIFFPNIFLIKKNVLLKSSETHVQKMFLNSEKKNVKKKLTTKKCSNIFYKIFCTQFFFSS